MYCHQGSLDCRFLFHGPEARMALPLQITFFVQFAAFFVLYTLYFMYVHRLVSLARPSHKERGPGELPIVNLFSEQVECRTQNVKEVFFFHKTRDARLKGSLPTVRIVIITRPALYAPLPQYYQKNTSLTFHTHPVMGGWECPNKG